VSEGWDDPEVAVELDDDDELELELDDVDDLEGDDEEDE
jgi:hypothetical protein